MAKVRASQRELVGGPLDGHNVTRKPGKYAWVKGRRTAALLSDTLRALPGARPLFMIGGARVEIPCKDAALYGTDGDVLLYAGHRTYLCRCGAYHGKAEGGREKRACSLEPVDLEGTR